MTPSTPGRGPTTPKTSPSKPQLTTAISYATKPPVCVLKVCDIEELLGYIPGNIIGWIEKDGRTGASSEEEVAHVFDQVEEGVTVHISCNNCTCSEGMLQCTNNVCKGCAYSTWSQWTACSKGCDVGNRIRSRKRLIKKGTADCNLPTEETSDCNFIPCEESPSWMPWATWESCSASCDVGYQRRTRKCQNKLEVISECLGVGVQIQACGLERCSNERVCTGGKVWSDCANECPLHCADYKAGRGVCQESDTCVPGCRCPENTLEQDGKCVKKEQCFCHDKYGTAVLENFETSSHAICEKWLVSIVHLYLFQSLYCGHARKILLLSPTLEPDHNNNNPF
uniref:TIL domain-containing protein n=1 Tax=Octopus bimaculoides TaxID=37653 RepID=A0A0L8FYA0_OCTBM